MGLRIGLVGCGHWGSKILRDLRLLGCEVPVVTEADDTIESALQGGASEVLSDVAEMNGVDGIIVATPMATHSVVLDAALELGVPVFCEKPVTVEVADAERLAEQAPDRLFVMHKWRYHPGVRELGRIARSGALGAVIGLSTERVQRGEAPAGVDAAWHLAPHDLSIALEVLGAIRPVRHAVGHVLHSQCVEMRATLGDTPWHTLHVSLVRTDRRRHVQLHCEDGTAWLAEEPSSGVFMTRSLSSLPTRIETPGEMPLLAELRAFADYLTGGPPPMSSIKEALGEVRAIAEMRSMAGVS